MARRSNSSIFGMTINEPEKFIGYFITLIIALCTASFFVSGFVQDMQFENKRLEYQRNCDNEKLSLENKLLISESMRGVVTTDQLKTFQENMNKNKKKSDSLKKVRNGK